MEKSTFSKSSTLASVLDRIGFTFQPVCKLHRLSKRWKTLCKEWRHIRVEGPEQISSLFCMQFTPKGSNCIYISAHTLNFSHLLWCINSLRNNIFKFRTKLNHFLFLYWTKKKNLFFKIVFCFCRHAWKTSTGVHVWQISIEREKTKYRGILVSCMYPIILIPFFSLLNCIFLVSVNSQTIWKPRQFCKICKLPAVFF